MSFDSRKEKLLSALRSCLPDPSPKGYPDVSILPLLSLVNEHHDYVTTSSCSGRITVYLEGIKTQKGGGKWLFITHGNICLNNSADVFQTLFGEEIIGVVEGGRNVTFNFEPFILHVSARTLDSANRILKAAIAAGFRESGIIFSGEKFTVGIRTSSRISAPIACYNYGILMPLVDQTYLCKLIEMANEKMEENRRKIKNFELNFRKMQR